MNESEVELSIGETVQIGDLSVTILDVNGDEIQVQIDHPESDPQPIVRLDVRRWIRPR